MTRRRPHREFFSFDSFLDVVANVVGIIIRLILVAWVGARSYKAVMPTVALPPPPALADPTPLPEPTDPRLPGLARRRREIAEGEREAEEEEKKLAVVKGRRPDLQAALAGLAARRRALAEEAAHLEGAASEKGKAAQALALSAEELQARSKKLLAEIEALKKAPPRRKELRYRTPVSQPVAEEVMFECHGGRVTLIDTAALLERIKKVMRQKGEQLTDRWEVSDVTEPVGAFRLRYVIERQRTSLDGVGGGPTGGSYRYGVSGWEVEPVVAERGETAEQALKEGSAFRRLIDVLDPQQTAVTFWVYPDSFELYRQLRDYLHDRDVVVAGRPLSEGTPIASSRKGTVSRGQ